MTEPVIGVVGGGQLARMMHQAAIGLGVSLRVVAHPGDEAAPAAVPDVRWAHLDDAQALLEALQGVDMVTFDHERVDPAVVRALVDAGFTVRPGPTTLDASDKGAQRHRLQAAGLPVPPFLVTTDPDAIADFGAARGWPVAVKTTRGGYDGRGVWRVEGPQQAAVVAQLVAPSSLLVEPWLPLERELAVLVARGPDDEAVTYPVVETRQHDGICHEVITPAAIPEALADQARALALAVAREVEAVGILAVELFVSDGRLLVNELAPRPHNSGHLTIDACVTSQFENHLRAVLGWPLGATDLVAPAAAMANVLAGPTGVDPRDRRPGALSDPGVRVHLYAKAPRPGRKVGHVTVLATTADEARARAVAAAHELAGPAERPHLEAAPRSEQDTPPAPDRRPGRTLVEVA